MFKQSNFSYGIKFSLVVFSILLILLTPLLSLAGMPELKPPMLTLKPGLFITGEAGVAAIHDSNIVTAAGTTTTADNFDARDALSFVGGGGVGWRFDDLFSVAVNYLYASFAMINHGIGSTPSFTFGNLTATSNMLFVNGFVDLATLFHLVYLIHPYFGVGLGVSWNRLHNIKAVTNETINTAFGASSIVALDSNTRTDFAYRLILGFSYLLMHRLLMFVQYSYLCAGKYEQGDNGHFVIGPPNLVALGNIPFTQKAQLNADMHLLTFGLIFST